MKLKIMENICFSIFVIAILSLDAYVLYCVHRNEKCAQLIINNAQAQQAEEERQLQALKREFEYSMEKKKCVAVENLRDTKLIATVEFPNRKKVEFQMPSNVCNYDFAIQRLVLSKVQVYYALLDQGKIPENSTVVSLCIEKCK